MNNGNTTIKSLLEDNSTVRLEESGDIVDFSEIDNSKPIEAVADKTTLSEEQVKTSRRYVKQFVNKSCHVLAKGTQGSGKSKAVIVAIYYLINHGSCTNFVYSAKTYDGKLDETWQDVVGQGAVYDPFTGEEIELGSAVDAIYLKGLDRLMDECREAEGLPKNAPLGIFRKTDTGEKTKFAKYCEHMGRKDALKYAEWPEDDYKVLDDWKRRKEKVREKAENQKPLVVVTPTAMRKKMSVFDDLKTDWVIFGDEISYGDRETQTIDLDIGMARELKEGQIFREGASDELVDKAESLGKQLERLYEGCNNLSLNDVASDEIKNSCSKRWIEQNENTGDLHISRKVDLFDDGLGLGDGINRGLMRTAIDSIYHPGRYWKSVWDGTKSLPELIEEEVEFLAKNGELEKAGKLNDLKHLWNMIRDMERYGAFMNEKHEYGSEEVKPGLTPHRVDGEKEQALLMTIKHELDKLFDQGFRSGNRLRILSASVSEEWFRRKLDRYERAYSFREDLNDYFEYIDPKLEENFQIKKVLRYGKTSWAMGKRKDEFHEFSEVFKPYIQSSDGRHGVMPKAMKEDNNWNDRHVNCWNSDVLGSNDAEGKDELFLMFTYSPPEIEMIMTYLDLEGEFPVLEYENKSSQIPKDYVEIDGKRRTGYQDPGLDEESSLSVAYKCQVETHIDDAVRRLREHYDEDKAVYLMCQETENIREMEDRVEEVRLWQLLAEVIIELRRDELEQFIGEERDDLIQWVSQEGFDIGGTPPDKIVDVIGNKMNWTIEEGVIEVKKTNEERFLENMPEDEWLWLTEILEFSPFGYKKSKQVLEGLEDVSVKEEEKPGEVPDSTSQYKF